MPPAPLAIFSALLGKKVPGLNAHIHIHVEKAGKVSAMRCQGHTGMGEQDRNGHFTTEAVKETVAAIS